MVVAKPGEMILQPAGPRPMFTREFGSSVACIYRLEVDRSALAFRTKARAVGRSSELASLPGTGWTICEGRDVKITTDLVESRRRSVSVC